MLVRNLDFKSFSKYIMWEKLKRAPRKGIQCIEKCKLNPSFESKKGYKFIRDAKESFTRGMLRRMYMI